MVKALLGVFCFLHPWINLDKFSPALVVPFSEGYREPLHTTQRELADCHKILSCPGRRIGIGTISKLGNQTLDTTQEKIFVSYRGASNGDDVSSSRTNIPVIERKFVL